MSQKRRRRQNPSAARKRRLEAAVQAIQQKWGSQALHKGARPAIDTTIPSLPTGLAQLDRLLSLGNRSASRHLEQVGGLPLGHISELIGQPTSGKRTLALHALAQAQRRHPCLYLDLAQTFDPAYAAACQVDLSRLAIANPSDPVQALDLACDLAAGGHFGLIIFDSTAELLTGSFAPGAAGAALRRLRQALTGKHSALLFLTSPFFGEPGSPTNYPASFALDQVAALRLVIDRQRWLRQSSSIRGYEARVTVLRHRWGSEGQQTMVKITFNGVHVGEA